MPAGGVQKSGVDGIFPNKNQPFWSNPRDYGETPNSTSSVYGAWQGPSVLCAAAASASPGGSFPAQLSTGGAGGESTEFWSNTAEDHPAVDDLCGETTVSS